METNGTWTKDADGFMVFSSPALQRLYESITDDYNQAYNRYLDMYDDDDAYYQAQAGGYELITDYKTIAGQEEFATTYITPACKMDVWYETDSYTHKRVFDRGFISITSK